VKIIDYSFAKKLNKLFGLKGRVETKEYMSPGLLKKGPKGSIMLAEVVTGDWYALGSSILEITKSSLNLREVNRIKAINRALEKIRYRFQILYSK